MLRDASRCDFLLSEEPARGRNPHKRRKNDRFRGRYASVTGEQFAFSSRRRIRAGPLPGLRRGRFGGFGDFLEQRSSSKAAFVWPANHWALLTAEPWIRHSSVVLRIQNGFSTIKQARRAYSSGWPSRLGKGTCAPSASAHWPASSPQSAS